MFRLPAGILMLLVTISATVPIHGQTAVSAIGLEEVLGVGKESKSDEKEAEGTPGGNGAFHASLRGRFRLLSCTKVRPTGMALGLFRGGYGRWLSPAEIGVFLI
jgi:hypothetical protein